MPQKSKLEQGTNNSWDVLMVFKMPCCQNFSEKPNTIFVSHENMNNDGTTGQFLPRCFGAVKYQATNCIKRLSYFDNASQGMHWNENGLINPFLTLIFTG